MSRGRTPEGVEKNREWSRNAKRKRTGTCADCGAQTRYNGHGVAVSVYCLSCAAKRRTFRAGVNQQAVLDVLRAEGPLRYIEISKRIGRDRNYMGQLLGRLLDLGLIVRPSRGIYMVPPPAPSEAGEPDRQETET